MRTLLMAAVVYRMLYVIRLYMMKYVIPIATNSIIRDHEYIALDDF